MDINTAPEVIERALAISAAVRSANHRHAFSRGVAAFTRLLAAVPDFPAREFSSDAIAVLGNMAEAVISRIEGRIGTGHDSQSFTVDLAEAVYDIRRALEEIDRWQRHYAGGPS